MVKIELLEPVLQLLNDKNVQEKVEEVARFFYSNGNVTVNLFPALFLGIITIFFVLPLLGVPLLDALFGSSVTSSSAYNTLAYGGAGGQVTQFTAAGYSDRSAQVELTEEQKALYPELAEIRDMIVELQESEYNLRNQLYYNTAATGTGLGDTTSNKISYTY